MPGPITVGERFDVVCVGDVASDAVVTLSAGCAEIRAEADGRKMVLPFGAKVPCEESVTVAAAGNAANAAVACARLGLRTALATYVGDDPLGRDAVAALQNEEVDTSFVRLDRLVPTNRNFVLRVGHERTILVHHEQHRYHWPHLRPAEIPAWLYLSSVGRDAHDYEDQIADWLEGHPGVLLAFEPGTYQIARGAARLARLYARAALVICNREEAAAVCGRSPGDDPVALLDGMLALGPRRVVITDGSAGAWGADGDDRYRVPIYPDRSPVVDRTGAGDAFAATLVAVIAAGRPLDEAMLWAPVNSMSVVHSVGTQAGLLRRDEMEALLAAAPAGYAVERVVHG